jgi:hypothetical protein
MVYSEFCCTYYDTSAIKCGDFYISNNGVFRYISFGESVEIGAFDIEKFIIDNDAKVVSIDCIDNMIVYLLHTNNLKKYRTLKGIKYNLQIAINKDFAKIGYPAIFDSF